MLEYEAIKSLYEFLVVQPLVRNIGVITLAGRLLNSCIMSFYEQIELQLGLFVTLL
jgi:hypothetical protein